MFGVQRSKSAAATAICGVHPVSESHSTGPPLPSQSLGMMREKLKAPTSTTPAQNREFLPIITQAGIGGEFVILFSLPPLTPKPESMELGNVREKSFCAEKLFADCPCVGSRD